MSLAPEEIKKIAYLARLNLSEQDTGLFASQLSGILDLIEQMNQTDTSAIEPLAHPLDLSQRMRDDKVTEPDLRAEYQAIAPKVELGLYLVPIVIE